MAEVTEDPKFVEDLKFDERKEMDTKHVDLFADVDEGSLMWFSVLMGSAFLRS